MEDTSYKFILFVVIFWSTLIVIFSYFSPYIDYSLSNPFDNPVKLSQLNALEVMDLFSQMVIEVDMPLFMVVIFSVISVMSIVTVYLMIRSG